LREPLQFIVLGIAVFESLLFTFLIRRNFSDTAAYATYMWSYLLFGLAAIAWAISRTLVFDYNFGGTIFAICSLVLHPVMVFHSL